MTPRMKRLASDYEQVRKDFSIPLNFLEVGEIENDDVRIYIHQNVYKHWKNTHRLTQKKSLEQYCWVSIAIN